MRLRAASSAHAVRLGCPGCASAKQNEPVPLASGEVLIRGRINSGQNCGESEFCKTMRLEYGLERFFVQQGEGREFLQHATRVKNVWVPYGV